MARLPKRLSDVVAEHNARFQGLCLRADLQLRLLSGLVYDRPDVVVQGSDAYANYRRAIQPLLDDSAYFA